MITDLLRVLGTLAPGHPSSYHRVFSRDRWSLAALARRYIAAVLARFVPRGPILLAGDWDLPAITEEPSFQLKESQQDGEAESAPVGSVGQQFPLVGVQEVLSEFVLVPFRGRGARLSRTRLRSPAEHPSG